MVKKIIVYKFSNKFKKEYKTLPKEVQEVFYEKLALFLVNMLHPSLRVKRIQGTKDRWEGSVTRNYRFTFHFEDDTVIFRRIGAHNILSKEG